jgi:hypothetical protein
VDEDANGLCSLIEREGQVAPLLDDPGRVRIAGAAGEMHPTGRKLDEEQDVHDAAPQRVSGEEVAGQNGGRLGAQELRPAGTVSTRGRPETCPSSGCPGSC